MKNSIVTGLILLSSAFLNPSFSMNSPETGDPGNVNTLIINGEVNVVLVNNAKATLRVEGKESLQRHLAIRKSGDTLFIDCNKNKNLKSFVTIYVPATQLKHIRINSGASVRSLSPLQLPLLDVVVNGDCSFRVSNFGKTNVRGTELFEVVQYSEERPGPVSLKE